MDIFDYKDFRQFLKDFYADQKQKNPRFSYRFFARMADLGGQSYLRMVMDGQRNLSLKSIKKFTQAIKMSDMQAAYFEALVMYNQAKKEKDRDSYFQRLIELRPSKKFHKLEKDSFEYCTKKHLVVIREMVALPHFKEDPEWIAQSLGGGLTAVDVRQAIKVLIRLGFLIRDEKGSLKQSRGTLKSSPDEDSLEVQNYHRSVLTEAKDAILNVDYQSREIISLTIPFTSTVLPKVKEILRKCQDDIAVCVNKGGRDFEEVFQVNMQMFPVTSTKKREQEPK